MTASWAFLAVSLWSALFTAVALRPPRRPVHAVALTFFAAWLTTEMAALHLAWQVVAAAAFVGLGALDHWPGVAALAVDLVSWAGLGVLLRTAMRTDAAFADALDAAIPDHPSFERLRARRGRLEWGRVWLPFHVRRPGVERVRDVPYAATGSRRHRLDVYRPARPTSGAPVLLQIHGGGWVIGSKEQQGLPLMYHLASRGWVCVAINYRLSPRATWPDHLVDCKRALAWIRAHVAEHGGDPSFVVVTGGSAGGHLAAMVGLTAGDPRYQPGFEDVDTSVRAMVPFYGVFDFTDRFGIRGAADPLRRLLERQVVKRRRREDPDVFADASPMERVHTDAPPALVVHGDLDTLAPVEEARRFVEVLRSVSREPVVYVELPGTHHAFDVFHSVRTLHAIEGVDAFLEWVVSSRGCAERSTGRGSSTATTGPTTTARTAP